MRISDYEIEIFSIRKCEEVLDAINDSTFWKLTSKDRQMIKKIKDRKKFLEDNGFLRI